MSEEPQMGTPEWREEKFSSDAARKLRGHSKATQYHGYHSTVLEQKIETQGRNECGSALALELLVTLGLISRVKAQPFQTDPKEFGHKLVPDFMAEGTQEEKPLYVIETKDARFYTPAVKRRHEQYRVIYDRFNIIYIVWTSAFPISSIVKHHLINMRAASCSTDVSERDIEALVQWVHGCRPSQATVANMYQVENMTRDVLWAAAWRGKVFFPLTKELDRNTVLALSPQEDYRAMFLERQQDWWQSLASA